LDEFGMRKIKGERTIPLPKARIDGSLGEALAGRRSQRDFGDGPLSLQEIANLCWAAYGANGKIGDLPVRVAPSAGATYPLELYVLANNITDLTPGLYAYDGVSHQLREAAIGDFSDQAAHSLNQEFVSKAAAVFVWTAVIERCARRYHERALRYVNLEAGHQAQDLLLTASASGLAACPTGAFFDEELGRLLGLKSGEEYPLYVTAVGRK
jgi:SagB-type dehydrogenase family enzyme